MIKFIDFIKDEKGQTSILFVFLLPILVLLLGWSVDVSRVLTVKTELYKASDIAAHEVAKSMDMRTLSEEGEEEYREEAQALAERWVQENSSGACGATLTSIETEITGSVVRVRSQASIPLLFNIFGERQTRVSNEGMDRIKKIKQP